MASLEDKAPPPVDSSSEEALKNEDISSSPPKKVSFFKRIWDKSGLNIGMLVLMAKGALPPAISLAIYQDTGVASQYSTLGYLVAIMSIISFAIMPRAKFIQTMTLNIIGVCIGAAVALLAIYCCVQARAHTTHPPPNSGPQLRGYNSSASAVSAVWLFANIYFINTLRAARPQLQFPVIIYSIFVNVALTNAPVFLNMLQGIAFAKRLLKAFLTGFAIAAGVSFVIFPMTSRTILLKQITGFVNGLQGSLKAQAMYLESLEHEDILGTNSRSLDESDKNKVMQSNDTSPKFEQRKNEDSSNAETLKTTISSLGELYSKMNAELTFAKREIAYGKLNATDLEQLLKLCTSLLLPITGMSSIADIFDRIVESRGWKSMADEQLDEKNNIGNAKANEVAQWSNIMKALHNPFEVMTEAMNEGLLHVLYTLEFAKPPKHERQNSEIRDNNIIDDVEAEGEAAKPGSKKFAMSLKKKVDAFYDQRKLTLATVLKQQDVDLREDLFSDSSRSILYDNINGEDQFNHKRSQRLLYLMLYMDFLLWSTSQAVLDLVIFADKKSESMSKKRVIVPGFKRFKKWVLNVLKPDDINVEQTPDNVEAGNSGIYLGDSFKAAKDPEHLPPMNGWERFTNGLMGISCFLASPESAFGFRAACATLTIGVVAFLSDTQTFFGHQRLVWAMIMVAISMTTTAGSGVFGFMGRIAGTTIAMCASIACWYIVDGKTGGVIPLLWLFITIQFYFVIRFPRFIIIAILSMVTQILIIGYELEVRKLGVKAATSNGQPAYPIYLLAPYRLACVTGGMAVSFIWTFFPYPITAGSQLRKDLGASLYLLANFYSIVHSTVRMRIRGEERDMDNKNSHGRKLEKARTKVFAKQLALLAGLRQHSEYTSWEPTFGGKFPKKKYDNIIEAVQNILNYMSLISYASKDFITTTTTTTSDGDPPSQSSSWSKDMVRLASSINITSHEITSLLALLSASVTNGTPLPPYLQKPAPFRLSERLEALDADILSVDHVAEPGYAAFAVMQIASSMIGDDLGRLIDNVKSLVGEVDFSFHAVSTSASSDESLDARKGKTD